MKKNRLQPKEEVHYSVKNRKRFKLKMWLIFFGLVLILLCCAAMFTFGTVTWNPDEGFTPKANVEHWWQGLLIGIGAVLAVGAIIGFFFICFYIFKGFYATQAVYMKTAKFKKAKQEALKVDLSKLRPSDLKWYKKICYITPDEFRMYQDQNKTWVRQCRQNKQKINYAKSKA